MSQKFPTFSECMLKNKKKLNRKFAKKGNVCIYFDSLEKMGKLFDENYDNRDLMIRVPRWFFSKEYNNEHIAEKYFELTGVKTNFIIEAGTKTEDSFALIMNHCEVEGINAIFGRVIPHPDLINLDTIYAVNLAHPP